MGNEAEAGKRRLTRLAGARYARGAAVTVLAAAAVGQAVAQAAAPGSAAGNHQAGLPAAFALAYLLPLTLLALLATVPLAVFRPATAAAAVTFGNAVALVSFGQVTAGGVTAELAAAWWLGLAGGLAGLRGGPLSRLGLTVSRLGLGRRSGAGQNAVTGATPGRYLALALMLPFAVPAVIGGSRAAVLLAATVPVAAGLGIAVWAGRLAQTRTAAGEALADTLLAHTARGERARIARELHDVVAHHISMIAVLSETGRLTTPGLPEAGARRFAEIGDTARAGLTEMRRLLGVLREDAGPAADPASTANVPLTRSAAAARQPQPGLGQLTQLIDAARDASLAGARLIISGPVAPLDPGVELAAYRIVQEALTNARRHAPGAAVDVELRYSAQTLRLRIRDNGPGPAGSPGTARAGSAGTVMSALDGWPAPGRTGEGTAAEPVAARPANGGHGLAGMRERAFSAGGSLYAGMAPVGGFLVEAVLPAGPDPTGAGR